MTNTFRILSLSLIAFLLVSLNGPATCRAQQKIPDAAVAKADALVRSGNYQQALAEALTAIQSNPTDFQPYYYAGYALYKLNRFDEAQIYAKSSLTRAPQDSKPAVQKLIDAIASSGSVQQSVAAADADASNGLLSKAADEYAAAWKASPDAAQDAGLKATHIWAERVLQPIKAAAILVYVVAHPQTPEDLKDAQSLLSKIQPQLNAAYNQNMNNGLAQIRAQQPAQALDALTIASQAEPANAAPHYEIARAYMMLSRPEDALKEMLRISQLGGTAQSIEASSAWQENLYLLALDPSYSGTLQDAFGGDLIAAAQKHVADLQAAQQARDRAKASFAETIAWLTDALPGATRQSDSMQSSSIENASGCSLTMLMHSQFGWSDSTFTFSLSDIDPSSVAALSENGNYAVNMLTKGRANSINGMDVAGQRRGALVLSYLMIPNFQNFADAQKVADAFRLAAGICANGQAI